MAAALANPRRRCRRLLATAESEPAIAAAVAAIDERRRPAVERVDRAALDRLLPPGSVHQGLALQAEPLSPPDLDELLRTLPDDAPATLLLLDQVTDPHNVGAILRSAAAFGAAAVIVTDRHAPPITGTLAKAASGAVEMVPMVRVVNLARAIESLRRADFVCVGLAEDAADLLAAGRPAQRMAVVLGAEGEGLRRLTRERCDRLVRLPTAATLASLNVSNAAAVALFALQPGASAPPLP
ncbi:MAG: 23S rRNA (guanosine(2251)-2'-O)-methyltransferase RlmB [Alphaproteobacteria bacterium]|nr:23S rRNA (guanosine(2251)-2'-O)-methyltransferase RlmB [Alphaproteobacteria bacterium]